MNRARARLALLLGEDELAQGTVTLKFLREEREQQSLRQEALAEVMLSPETQVAFNLKKGSLPVRGDVDLTAANDCMKKGLEVLKAGNVIQSTDELISPDTVTQLNDLMTEFFSTDLPVADAQKRFADLIANAD